jgi:hypothetical protein
VVPLIHVSPALTLAFLVFYAALAIAFVMANWQYRAALVVVAIFTNGIHVDFGVALNPTRVLGLMGAVVYLFEPKSITRGRFESVIIKPMLVLMAYVVVVTVIGAINMPNIMHELGGFRTKEWRPVIALATHFLTIPLIWIIFRGLEDRRGVAKFFDLWMLIALGSCGLAMVQELTHFVGKPLWGIFREEYPLTFQPLFGVNFLRVNALAGEPKALGVCLFITLVVLLSLDRSFSNTLAYRYRTAMALLMFGTIGFTFSTGAYVAIAALLSIAWFQRAASLKVASVVVLIAVCGYAVYSPKSAQEFYETRLARFFEKITNSRDLYERTVSVERASDDKDNAAAAFILMRPELSIIGLGVGPPPYYYNHLVVARYRGKLQEPNSGLVWVLLSVGVIGAMLFLGSFGWILLGKLAPLENRQILVGMSMAILVLMISYRPFEWIAIALGLGATPAWWILSAGAKPLEHGIREPRGPSRMALEPRRTESGTAWQDLPAQ